MNIEDSVERPYGIAEMEPREILAFGHTPLVIRLIERVLVKNGISHGTARASILEIGSGTCQGSYIIKNEIPERSFIGRDGH